MTRSIYGAIFIGVLAAACGGNNGDSHACGDGIVNGSEQCDDGNVISGDGCSSSCQKETPSTCGDGVLDVATEGCDDGNVISGDGCDSHCRVEGGATCGNGTIETGEACDDGNHASADGCSATCQVESGYTCTGTPSVCTMGGNVTGTGTCADPFVMTLASSGATAGSGDTTNATNQVPEGSCDGLHFSGGGNDQVFSFTLAAPADITIAVTADFDVALRFMTTACDTTTEVADVVAHDGCADLNGAMGGETLTSQRLAAGTYYFLVDGYTDTESGPFTVSVTPSAPTGACGDGTLDSYEECDDTNTTPGDRCSATCTLEYDVMDTEPNDDAAHAQAIAAAHHIVRGSLTAGDADLYTFTLTAATTVEIETYDAEDPMSDNIGLGSVTTADCIFDDHILSVFDSTGDVADDATALFSDEADGDFDDVNFIGGCAYIGPNNANADGTLPAGTYTVKIEDGFGYAQKNYVFDVKFGNGGSGAVAPVAGDLKINEVMLADGTTADTNCDTATTGTNDEFVEIVNVSGHAVDLTGVTLWDAASLVMTTPAPRHTFAAATSGSMTLDPGKAVVVWGGGAPACAGVTDWFVASSGALGLNDTGGETITLKTGNATSTTLATATWGDATIGTSFNLNPDITGTAYVLHDAITGHAGAFSPGKKNDGTAF